MNLEMEHIPQCTLQGKHNNGVKLKNTVLILKHDRFKQTFILCPTHRHYVIILTLLLSLKRRSESDLPGVFGNWLRI